MNKRLSIGETREKLQARAIQALRGWSDFITSPSAQYILRAGAAGSGLRSPVYTPDPLTPTGASNLEHVQGIYMFPE